MSEYDDALDSDIAEMLAAYREEEDIPADAKARIHERLGSAPPLSPAPAGGLGGKLLWGGIGAGLILAAILIVPRLDLSSEPEVAAVVDEPVEVEETAVPVEPRAPMEQPSAPMVMGVASMASEPPPEPADEPEVAEAVAAAEPLQAKPAKHGAKKSRKSTPEQSPEPAMSVADSLAAETALLRRAQAALSGGNPKAALSLLREHQRKFEAGVLVEERRALMAIALCDDGQSAKGQMAAKLFARKHAGSALDERVRTACQEDSP